MKTTAAALTILALAATSCGGMQSHQQDALKVTRAVIYQNGIGYFERYGKVDAQKITLRIMPQQIADVLKSLTVVDRRSGRAVNVALPVEKTHARQMADLPRQVREGGGLIAIAQAFRGARAGVSGSCGSAEGRLVGVEQLASDGTWRLSLLTDSGALRSFDLAKISRLQLQDRTLEVGLRKALDLSLDAGSWKPVELTVHLAGETPHELLVSYVVEMPTWKPAYRVVLREGKQTGLLQGWAVVDNVSGEDWDKVSLSLTAGTPLTFTYDLYTPRFLRRPDLSPPQEQLALAPPPPTDGALEDVPEESVVDRPRQADESAVAGSGREAMKKARPSMRSQMAPSRAEVPRPLAAPPPPPQMTAELMEKSFQALVSGSRVGSLFRYDIDEPVTIRDGQSALVSILNQQVPAEDVLLYRVDAHTSHPYRAVRLKNTTGYILEKGPVAIYKDGNFVGEAVGGQVETTTSAFIPYSLDGRVLITLQDEVKDEGVRLIKILRGQITAEVKRVAVFKYTIHNNTGEPATLFVQRRHRVGWTLIAPREGVLLEKENYFVPVKVASKGKTAFEVREETPVRQTVGLFSPAGRQAIALYLENVGADPKTAATLREALALQDELGQLEEQLERLRRAKQQYSERQEEVRDNLKLLGKSLRNADLARQLTATLLELESKLNELTRELVQKDMKRSELRDRLTVLIQSVSLKVE